MKFYIQWILTLQIALSGFTPVFAQESELQPPAAPAIDAKKEVSKIPGVDLEGLFNDVSNAYERALYPNDVITLRTMGGPLKSQDLDALTDRLFELRRNLKQFIEAQYLHVDFKTVTVNGQNVNTTDENTWLAAVYLYVTMTELLERTRMAMGESIDPVSWSRYDLSLNLENFSLMEFLLTASIRLQTSEASAAYPIMTTRLDRKQNLLIFSLNPERSINLYTDYLANQGSAEGVKNYLAWTAYYGLYQNLAKLNQLQTRPTKMLQEPSPAIQARFPIAHHLHALAYRSDERFIWQRQFAIIRDQIPNILRELQNQNIRFVNADFVRSMLTAVGRTLPDPQLSAATSQLAGDEDMTSNTQTAGLLYLGTTHPPRSEDQWVNLVVDAIVDFKALAQRFDRVATESLNLDQKRKVLSLIETRAQQLKTDPELIATVRSKLQPILTQLSPEQVLWAQRQDFNSALIKKAEEVRNIPDEIDIPSWLDARRADFPTNPSANVTRWTNSLAKAKNWDEAEAQYESILFAYLSSFNLGKGNEWLAKTAPVPLSVLQARAADFTWDSDYVAKTLNIPENLRPVLAKQNPARHNDLLQWIAVGRALMFDRARGMTLTTLMQKDCSKETGACSSVLTASDRKSYEQAYQRNMMMMYPILSSLLTPDNMFLNAAENLAIHVWDGRAPLWKKLGKNNNDPNGLINSHLLEIEKNILNDFSYLENSLQPASYADQAVHWISRKAGFSKQAESLDSIRPEFLVLIEKGSMLAGNINQRKVLAGTFNDMRDSLKQESDFSKGVEFLNSRATEIINAAVVVAIIQGLASYFDKTKLLVGGSRLLMSWLEPAFGPNATYLQKFSLYWIGGQMAYYGFQSLSQKDQLIVLGQFYNSIAAIPQDPTMSNTDAVAQCAIHGQCLATQDDMLKQSLATFDNQFKFAVYTIGLAGVAAFFKGIAPIKRAGRWVRDRAMPARETWTSRTAQDFRMLGLNPDKYTFSRALLDNKYEGSVSQIESVIRQFKFRDATAQAMAERAWASALEQSRARLEQTVLEESKRWQTLTDVYRADIDALGLNPSIWWEPKAYAKRMMQIESTPHSSTEMMEIIRHRRNLEQILTKANNRAASDPIYSAVLQGAFQRHGLNLENEFQELEKVLDPRIHISNLIRTSKGNFTLVPGVPAEMQKMIRVMNDKGLTSDKAIRDEQVLKDFVRAIHNKLQWRVAR